MVKDGLIDFVPEATQEDDTKVEYDLGSVVFPSHAGKLQPLCEDGFAGSFSNSATDR